MRELNCYRVLWLYTVIFLIQITNSYQQQNVYVTVPSVLYIGEDNELLVRTRKIASTIKVTTLASELSYPVLDETHHEITKLSDDWYGATINYAPSFYLDSSDPYDVSLNFTLAQCSDSNCEVSNNIHLEGSTKIARRSALVLGETDKVIYRPAETVRIRFLTLPPQSLIPRNRPLKYPRRKLDLLDKKIVEMTPEQVAAQTRLQYDQVTIYDNKQNVVKQWLSINPREAANLSYSLLADAPEGLWSIRAQIQNKIENLEFTVSHFVLPRFVMTISPPGSLTFGSKSAVYSVCAKYSDGPPMRGSVRSQLCVCSTDCESCTKTAVLESNTCSTDRHTSASRSCIREYTTLDSTGCASFNVSLKALQLTDSRYPMYGQKPVICAEVIEEGTGSNVTKCHFGQNLERRNTELVLTISNVHKPGLPISGSVRMDADDTKDMSDITIKLELEEFYGCYRPQRGPSNQFSGPQFRFTTYVKVNASGMVNFVLPPMHTKNEISVSAKVVKPRLDSSSTEKEMLNSYKNEAYARISPWKSIQTSALQTWPTQENVVVQCPGTVTLNLMATTPLVNKKLFVQSVVRGKFVQRVISPVSTSIEPCVDQDNELGHYKCVGEGIKCLPGWTGANCMYPICSEGCNRRGASCTTPHTCNCFDGWTGVNCDECIRRPGCVNGKCVEGDDCVCDGGWHGYICDQKRVIYQPIPYNNDDRDITDEREFNKNLHSAAKDESNEVRRTIYQRTINFTVDGDWGPEATIVVFFHDTDGNGTQLIPTNVKLIGLDNCSNPAIAEQSESSEAGIKFNKPVASPGESLQLLIRPSGIDHNTSSIPMNNDEGLLPDQVCFAQLSDISLDNFQSTSTAVSLSTFAKKLQELHTLRVWRPMKANNVKDSFKAAGFEVILPPNEIEIIPVNLPCFFARSGSPVMYSYASYQEDNQVNEDAPRLREFFPEVWLFDILPIQSYHQSNTNKAYGVTKDLVAPDTITTWRASAYCTTRSNGLWIGQPTQLTVSMPFFVELTLPKQVKRGEILYLPVSVFVNPNMRNNSECLQVSVSTRVDESDWMTIGSTEYTGCVCSGEKQTFQLGLLSRKLGLLNVTAEARAIRDSVLCSGDGDTLTFTSGETDRSKTLTDMIRRQVRVVPEGIPRESTVGGILCLSQKSKEVNQRFPLILPEQLVEGSLRVYHSYSDEVLGPALRNPERLVRLPMGCGEQNMLLVAPNVYVLDYLKSVPVVNKRETEKLVRTARMHIASGYKRQLKYRHSDGSYSAFGESDGEGSTWLTAFVLRVFAKAYSVDASLDVDWSMILDTAIDYLGNRQDIGQSGCFVEKGRVLNSKMQGGLNDADKSHKQLLLTAYVLSALSAVNVTQVNKERSVTSIKEAGLNCLQTGLDKPGVLKELSTYAIAQLAYALSTIQPQSKYAQSLQDELLQRQHTEMSGAAGERTFWLAKQDATPTTDGRAEAADIETTSYAYLSLTKSVGKSSTLFPVIRWLSSQQTSDGGFRSTQDTVLGLEAISHGAKALGLKNQEGADQILNVAANVQPIGHVMQDKLTTEKRRVSNQFAVPYVEPQQANQVHWSLSSNTQSGAGCVAVQTVMFYNVPESDVKSEAPFRLTANVRQQSLPPNEACLNATITTCLFMSENSVMHRESGMLLIRIHMVTGWQPAQKGLSKLIGNQTASARKIEVDDEGSIALYFDGFTQDEADTVGGWSKLKRCSSLQLHQTTYVENSQPAQITAMDYYATERSVQTHYQLDQCKSSWVTDSEPDDQSSLTTASSSTELPVESTTIKPFQCPVCGISADHNTTLSNELLDATCSSNNNLFVVSVHSQHEQSFNATFSVISSTKYVATWNATLNYSQQHHCKCDPIQRGSHLVLFSPDRLPISAGDPVVPIEFQQSNVLLVPAQDILWNVEQAVSHWNVKVNSSTVIDNTWRCKRIVAVHRYLKSKLF